MLSALLAIGTVFAILVGSEYLWRSKRLQGEENARKLVHIVVGSFIAFWPYFVSMRYIQIIAGMMLVVIVLSRVLHIFRGIHTIKRKTYGDIVYPITIFILATWANSPEIFTAAMLHLSLADGLAAVVGNKYGKNNSYAVFGEIKSVAGTLTCTLVSAAIIASLFVFVPAQFDAVFWPLVLWLPLTVAALENISPYGFDNVVMPVTVMVVLNSLQFVS